MTVERATATGDVDMVSGAGAAVPGSAAPASGAKRLRSQRLEVSFRSKGILQQALATGAASLEIEPGPLETQERRRVSGPRLRFDFDIEGRLASVGGPRAAGARASARDRSLLTASRSRRPRASRGASRATLSWRRSIPKTGAVREAVFEGAVVFSEPGRQAWAGHSAYSAAAGTLVLTRDPRIVDEAEGSELRGREIRIGTRTRAVAASGNVRHSRRGEGASGPVRGPAADRVRVPRVRVRAADAHGALPRERARPPRDRRGAGTTDHARRAGAGAEAHARDGRFYLGAASPAREGCREGAGGGRGAQPRAAVRGGEEPHRVHGRRGDPPGRHPDAQPRGDRAADEGRRDGRAAAGRRARRGAPGRAPRHRRARHLYPRERDVRADRREGRAARRRPPAGRARRSPSRPAATGSVSTVARRCARRPSSGARRAPSLERQRRPGGTAARPARSARLGAHQGLRTAGRRARGRARDPSGRGGGPARAERRGQDHDLLHGGGAGAARRGLGDARGRGDHGDADVPARARRDRLSAAGGECVSASSPPRRTCSRSSRCAGSPWRSNAPGRGSCSRSSGSRRWLASPPTRCRGAKGGGSRFAARWPPSPRSSCSTSRSPASTRSR